MFDTSAGRYPEGTQHQQHHSGLPVARYAAHVPQDDVHDDPVHAPATPHRHGDDLVVCAVCASDAGRL